MLQWNRVFLLWGALAVGSAGCGDEVMADLCPDDPAKTEAGACAHDDHQLLRIHARSPGCRRPAGTEFFQG